jgi:RNA polymerase sigma-70 factor (ECF subfamily)
MTFQVAVALPHAAGAHSPSQSRANARARELYRAHGAAVLARCRRLLRHTHAAEDATQETFVRVLKHLEGAPEDADARKWLYRIATNICLNELRRSKTVARFAVDAGLTEGTRAGSAEESLARRDLARRVFTRLPEHVRAISILRHVDGMHDQEVASELGMSRRTVVYRLAAFKQGARRALDQLG